MKKIDRRFITTKIIFTISIIVASLTIIGVWLLGLGQNRTLFENSILSTSILSIVFFLFLLTGLYNGIKLKDNIGDLTDKIKIGQNPEFFLTDIHLEAPDLGDDIGGLIVGIFAWILFSIVLLIFIWIFQAVLWILILVFIAMLYWIFYRALRLVFKNSHKCKDDIAKSVFYGLGYTLLYNFWIYSIILVTHYIIK